MRTLLRRYFWAVELAVVAVCGLLAARVVAAGKEIQAIVERNIFCSACRGAPAARLAEKSGWRRTTLPLRLVAIMNAPPPWHERWSLAIIRDDQSRRACPFALGSIVRGATIGAMDDARVTLVFGDGRRELLDLREGPDAPPGPANADLRAAGITRTGEHSFEVRRELVDELLADAGALGGLARVVPEVRGGRAVGFRLLRVRPDGLLARIGLEGGDVILAVNGLEMSGAEQALQAYTRLARASDLSVALERGGRRITLDYAIR